MPFPVLTVCLGNVCRSPLAERLLALRLREHGVADPEVGSAGVRALVGRPMDPTSASELAARGGSPDGFAARQLTETLVRPAGLVLVATKDLRSRVLEDSPGALRRTFTVREMAALCDWLVPPGTSAFASPAELVAEAAAQRSTVTVEDYDVTDPIGRSAETHAAVATVLDEALTTVASALARSGLR